MVIEWTEWKDGTEHEWDAALVKLEGYSVYQAYGWGEYKRRTGWSVRRGSVLIDGSLEAMAQCLVRELRLPRVAIVWVPGGPAGTLAGRLHLGRALQERYRGWSLCLRTNIVVESRSEDASAMAAAGWTPATHRVGHPLTFHLDLSDEEPLRRQALHGNWRHNLKRGEERGTEIRVLQATDPLDAIYPVYREMSDLKGLATTLGLDDLAGLRSALGANFMIAASFERDGAPSGVRAFARIGERAYDLIAAVTEAGRREYASYPLLWTLLARARSEGVRMYDLSGADPVDAAGVYNFKRGLGGREVKMLGEWEWATSRVLRWGINRLLAGRSVKAREGVA